MDAALNKCEHSSSTSRRNCERAIRATIKQVGKGRASAYVCAQIAQIAKLSAFNGSSGARRRRGFARSPSLIAKQKREAEELDRGARQIVDAVPFLTRAQARAALREHRKDVSRAMNWIMTQLATGDAGALLAELDGLCAAAGTDGKAQEGLKSSSSSAAPALPMYPPGGIAEFLKLVSEPTLIYKIDSVRLDEGVRVRPVFDRNGITIDPGKVPVTVIPLQAFMQAASTDGTTENGVRIMDAKECQRVASDARERVLEITYQSFSRDDFSPIATQPAGLDLFKDYKVDYNHETARLCRVYHRSDGPVLFKGKKDMGTYGLWGDVPIEIFSRAESSAAHRILHMHINDIRDDVAVDSVNLTGTGRSVDSVAAMEKDTTGRMLTYKIVVLDGQVKAVFHQLGGKTLTAKFKEHVLPAPGGLVAVQEDRLARLVSGPAPVKGGDVAPRAALAELLWLPDGMLVCTEAADAKSDEDRRAAAAGSGAPPCAVCEQKHPVELPGLVDVRVVVDAWGQYVGGRKETAADRTYRIPVCAVRTATEQDGKRVQSLAGAARDKDAKELLEAVAKLETQIREAEAVLGSRNPSAEDLARVTSASEMDALRSRIQGLAAQPGLDKVVDPARMVRIGRGLRSVATQRRLCTLSR